MSAVIHALRELNEAEIRADLIIKLNLPNAISTQGQSCRRMPTIELTLSVYYEE